MNIWEKRLEAGCDLAFARIFDNFHRDIELAAARNSPEMNEEKTRITNIFTNNFILLLETRERARKAMSAFVKFDKSDDGTYVS